SKKQLLQQFTIEFLLTTLLSAGIAILATMLAWQPFVDFIGKDIPWDILLDWRGALLLVSLIFLPGLFASFFPSALLTRIDPTQLLKGQQRTMGRKTLRLGLVVVQFAITTFLILCTLVVFQQYQRLSHASLGFEQVQLINIKVEDREIQKKIGLLQAEMARVKGVASVGASSESLPSDMNNRWRVHWDEASKARGVAIDIVGVDDQYFSTIQTPITEGTNFLLAYRSDSARSVILNETAARMMDVNEAGAIITIEETERRVIGVVSDHHYQSMKSEIEPVAYMVYGPGRRVSPDNLLVRVNVRELSGTITELNRIWDKVAPGSFFDFHFVDEAFQNAYNEEAQFSQLFTLFTVLSIVISCIGLLGIVIYLASEKQKEVCIRKVMGSSNWQLTAIVMKELGLMVLIGMALAVPAAIWSLNLWLEQFVFRVPIEWTVVTVSVLITASLAALAMGRNVLQLIHSNPVRFLRNE
ncbi:MAG: FtsX-like permease family protein, partial [Bacteroidota bacterium]